MNCRLHLYQGKLLVAADALSQATITKTTNNVQRNTEELVELHVQMVLKVMPISDARFEETQAEHCGR